MRLGRRTSPPDAVRPARTTSIPTNDFVPYPYDIVPFYTKWGAVLAASLVRVLVVDDFEPFRRFICSTLEKRPELHIVSEVSDGLEAVHEAEELRPDLILLDIGLPSLNGIEAARRIRKVSSESKILFISPESSADVVRVALGMGALGYIVKTDAGIELLEAVNAVLRGEMFVGRRFTR